MAIQQLEAAAAACCGVISRWTASRHGTPVPRKQSSVHGHTQHSCGPQLGPSCGGLDHTCVPMVAHMFRRASVAEGACPGSFIYVQGSRDRASNRISLYDWKTCVISCKYILITHGGTVGLPAPLENPSYMLQTTFSFPGGIKILAFPLLLQREPGQSPGSTRLFLTEVRYQHQHECNSQIIFPMRSEGPMGRKKRV